METRGKRFRALLEPLPGNLGWVIARLPFDPSKAWKKMVRLRILVEAGGQSFRTALFVDADKGGHYILVNKKMQQAAGVTRGSMIDLTIQPDLEERSVETPQELAQLFRKEKALARWYTGLSDSMRREIARTIEEIKAPEARQRRVDQLAERMLLTMEGEKELPPILEVAFRRAPRARQGWELMTPVQRRGSLMGVFYYQTPEARERRTAKVVAECLQILDRKAGNNVKGEDA